MATYRAPRETYAFVLHEVLKVHERVDLPGFADLTPDFTAAVLDGAATLSEKCLFPLNRSGDEQGCRFEAGEVRTPRGFREAYQQVVDGGWPALCFDPQWGGQGLPQVLALPVSEMLVSANMGLSGYFDITQAACALLEAHAPPELQALYLPPMVSGRWSGAMHLTEPQAGSDLGLVRTRARPVAEDRFRIEGSKIFITGVDHDLTENVVNLVLARIDGAPLGSRGLSLFLVPKFLPDAEGRPAQRNGVRVTGVEHKMGVRASATCSVVYEDAVGWLIGPPGQGLRTMFTMINHTRLGVGVQGLGMAEVAMQNAQTYARERLQGRAPGGPAAPQLPADPIASHPDVQRMLATMRAFVEPARALALWTAVQLDTVHRHPEAERRREAEDDVALLTPVIKAHFTAQGSKVCDLALQCFGGHGYIRETGVEQFWRDIRVGQIYEGTNGIQGLDLVSRKIHLGEGRVVDRHFRRLERLKVRAASLPRTAELATPLATALAALRRSTEHMQSLRDTRPADLAAGASDYLRLFGQVTLGGAALALALADPDSDTRVSLARFALYCLAVEAPMLAARAKADADTLESLTR